MFRKSIAFLLAIIFLVPLGATGTQAATLDLHGRVIVLDAGHGAGTTNVFAGYDEQVAMLKLAQNIRPLLEARGATVVMTRDDHVTVPLPVRAAMINILALEALRDARQRAPAGSSRAQSEITEINRLLRIMQSIIDDPDENAGRYMNTPFTPERKIHPDLARAFQLQNDPEVSNRFLVISLHSNATAPPINTAVNGANAFHICNTHRNTSNYYTGYSFSEQSRRFGDILLDYIAPVGLRRRSVDKGNYFMIREHNVPGVLVENGFHTNARDRANLSDDGFLERLAVAYRDAIVKYFNELPPPGGSQAPPGGGSPALPPGGGNPALPFTDVRIEAWYFEAVSFVTERELLRGTSPTRFSPAGNMTRAMLTTVLARLGGVNTSGYSVSPFSDVPIDAWYGRAVAWAADNGIVGPISAGSRAFEPNRYATREEIALVVHNFLTWEGLVGNAASNVIYEDDARISQRNRTAVYTMRSYGVMQGDSQNRFHPRNTATRAEVSQILYNIVVSFY